MILSHSKMQPKFIENLTIERVNKMKLPMMQVAELVAAVQLIEKVQDDASGKIYGTHVSRGLGVSDVNIQLDMFLETFVNFDLEEKQCSEYPYEVSKVMSGVRFKALVSSADFGKLGLLEEVI